MNQEIKERIKQIKNKIVPIGYKVINGNIVPQDYTQEFFGDIFEFYGALGIPREQLTDEGIEYLHYGDLHKYELNYISYNQYCNKPKYNKNILGNEHYLLKDGDVVFVDASEDLEGTSKSALINNPDNRFFISGLHTFIGRPKNNNIEYNYRRYLTSAEYVKKQFYKLASGFKVYGVSRETIKKIYILHGNYDEQKRIAEILMSWDKIITKQQQYIDKLREQRKSILQKLLKPKENWKEIKLSEILNERKNYYIKDGTYNHVSLTINGITDKGEQYDRDFLVKDADKKYKITHMNDLCYNPANLKFGVICINRYGDAIFSPIYVTFEVNEKYDIDLMEAIVTSSDFIRKIRKFEEGTLYERQAVKSEDFLKGVILFPSDQKEIEKISSTIKLTNKNIKLQEKKLDLLELQRKAIQKLLLTGIIRV